VMPPEAAGWATLYRWVSGTTRYRGCPSSADEITVWAPSERVDLEALKRPRLGGREPRDDDYRV